MTPPRTTADVPDTWTGLVAAGWATPSAPPTRAAELADVRRVAAVDLGLARILDGHRNALERLDRHRPEDVSDDVRLRVAGDPAPIGVWGADPRAGEGSPAVLVPGDPGRDAGAGRPAVVRGVKTFCSGAGLARLALVLVRADPAGRADVLVLLDVADPSVAEVDRTWFASPAIASSHSHRVAFHDAPVLAVLGAPGALAEEPWISGDALRTAATWLGALDAVVLGVREAFAGREPTDAEALLAGRMAVAHATAERWILHAGSTLDAGNPDAPAVVLTARLETSERAREVLRLAAELTGSHAIATDAHGARAARDLDLLLLQHRLTPAAVRVGRRALGAA